MIPFEFWQKNKGRTDLRKVTRDFEKKFRVKKKCEFEPGRVYAITYTTDSNIPTDKHHVTPIILSMGSFYDENGHVNIRGVNLLYLTTKQTIEILNDAYFHIDKKPGGRVVPIVKLHDRYMEIFPWSFKNFNSLRIKTAVEIDKEDWGFIALIYKYLLGNFNATALNEDFQTELKKKPKKITKPTKKEIEEEDEEENVEIYEDELVKSSGFIDLDIEE